MSLSNAEALKKTELFDNLSEADIEKLAVTARRLRYGPNHVLFRQGDPGLGLYVVTSGEIRIGLEALPGEDVIPTLMGPGEAFGELALLDDQPRSASATTTMDTELLMLGRDDFLSLVDSDPRVNHAVLRSLAAMIRRTNDRLSDVLLSVHSRMSKALITLAERHGVEHEKGVLIDRPVTDIELAGMTSLHRIEVERILRDYQYDDLIWMEEGQIIIRHPDKLHTWARAR